MSSVALGISAVHTLVGSEVSLRVNNRAVMPSSGEPDTEATIKQTCLNLEDVDVVS